MLVKDDPSRTADYGHFPWEREPEEISDHDAAAQICTAIASGRSVYGYDADALVDILMDMTMAEARDAVLTILFPGAYPNQTDRTRRLFKEMCGRLANELRMDL